MGALLLLLLLAVILAGVGFAVHVLWWVAVVVFVIWLVSLFIGRGSRFDPPGKLFRPRQGCLIGERR